MPLALRMLPDVQKQDRQQQTAVATALEVEVTNAVAALAEMVAGPSELAGAVAGRDRPHTAVAAGREAVAESAAVAAQLAALAALGRAWLRWQPQ